MTTLTLARNAMATRFELVLSGADPVTLRAAGEAALDEIDRLEGQLSLYRPSSEIAHVNARAAIEPVRVSPPVFRLLELAKRLTAETGGAFDITIAPLVRCWGFMGGTGHLPDPEDIAKARARVGIQLVHLDADQFTVRFERPGVMLDLGAIGKGYAVEQAVDVLREAGITSALLHGGTSTVFGLGAPETEPGWKVAIENPRTGGLFATVVLREAALSVSAVWGRSFESGGRSYGHVLDPRTGQPTTAAALAAIVLPSATETDALSTALLTRGAEGHDTIASLRPQTRTLLVTEVAGGFVADARGIPLNKE